MQDVLRQVFAMKGARQQAVSAHVPCVDGLNCSRPGAGTTGGSTLLGIQKCVSQFRLSPSGYVTMNKSFVPHGDVPEG